MRCILEGDLTPCLPVAALTFRWGWWVKNEDEGLADVCLTLPTAATERRRSSEVNLFVLLIFLRQEPLSVPFFLKWPNFVRGF